LRGIHDSKSPVECLTPTAAKRIIAAGIKDQEFHLHAGIIHTPENPISRDGMIFHIGGLRELRPDGEKIVQALNLSAVSREVEESDTPLWNPSCEVPNSPFHRRLVSIANECNLKTETA